MKRIKSIILLIITLSFTSCFEILEDIKLNKNGSGTYKLIVNMNQSKNQIQKLMTQDSIFGNKIPSANDISAKIEQVVSQLSTQKGISNTGKSIDFNTFIFKVNFDFDKTENLNLAVNKLIKLHNPKAVNSPIIHTYNGSTYSKIFNEKLIQEAIKNKNKISQFVSDLEKAKITTITRFETEIRSTTHTNAKISSNKKNCFEQYTLNNLLNQNELQSINISTK